MDGSSEASAFRYISQADGVADGTYFIYTSLSIAKALQVVHHAGRAWALVMLKQSGSQPAIYTNDAVGPTSPQQE